MCLLLVTYDGSELVFSIENDLRGSNKTKMDPPMYMCHLSPLSSNSALVQVSRKKSGSKQFVSVNSPTT